MSSRDFVTNTSAGNASPSTERVSVLPNPQPVEGTESARGMRRVVIIGAGPGGICAAVRLRQAGYTNITIVEKAGGVGGTWWHNRYPGAAVDVQSNLYSFSFEPKLDWTRPYPTQPEILDYLEHCARAYDLHPIVRFGTEVRSARWHEAARLWRVTASDAAGEEVEIEADIVVSAMGMFNELNWPDIRGLETFAGTIFHSARWNHDHDLTGERVAVIGSAASAVQFVPEIAPATRQLHLFQRSANWVTPKDDVPYSDDVIARHKREPELVADARDDTWRRLEQFITFSIPKVLKASENLALSAITGVDDLDLRGKLTPTTPFGSHRPLISNNYYPTFNRPNVELVTDEIDFLDADAIVTVDGRRREVETIVVATGFKTTKYLSAIETIGRDGCRISEVWRAGAYAYLGISTPGFPNMFQLYGPNTNNGSILYMIECQVDYIVRQLQRMDVEGLAATEVRADVTKAYNEEIQAAIDSVEVWRHHQKGYYRGESGQIVTQWPFDMKTYRARTSVDDSEAYLTETIDSPV